MLAPAERHADGTMACTLSLPLALPDGYHRLTLKDGDTPLGAAVLIVAPIACYEPPALAAGGRIFGPAAQLYALRSRRNWGIGDFTDLATHRRAMGRAAAPTSSASIRCTRCSRTIRRTRVPTARRRRLFLNTLYIDVEAIAEFARVRSGAALRSARGVPGAAGARCARRDCVDYAGVAGAKLRGAASCSTRTFASAHLARGTPRATRPSAPSSPQGGAALRAHALFDALQRALACAPTRRRGAGRPGPRPIATRDGAGGRALSPRQHRASGSNTTLYLQWQAEVQLAGGVPARRRDVASASASTATSRSRSTAAAPMRWAHQSLYALGGERRRAARRVQPARPGLGPAAAHAPTRCASAAYAPFIATLRANMRHAGALRIDHVMGLARLFWVPRGQDRRATAPTSLSARRPAGDRSRSRASAIAASSSARTSAPCPTRCARRCARRRRAFLPAALLRARRRRRVQAAAPTIPRDALVAVEHARPADARRLVARPRHRAARGARPVPDPDAAQPGRARPRRRARAPAGGARSVRGCCRPAGARPIALRRRR